MDTDKILAEAIAKDYVAKGTSKMIALQKLDRKAKLPAQIFAYSFGIVSILVFGTGLCLAMKVIGNSVALGVIVGTVGLICCGVNYLAYNKILKKSKEKYAYDIITLAREIVEQ